MEIENLPTFRTTHHLEKGYKCDEGEPYAPKEEEDFHFNFFSFFTGKADISTSLPVRKIPKSEFADSPTIRVWWLGHACNLIQVNNKYIITDPVFDKYASPVPLFINP